MGKLKAVIRRRFFSYLGVAGLVLGNFPGIASGANPFMADIKKCLEDFDGIAWQLPYRPAIDIRSCATPKNKYSAQTTPAGKRILELIGEASLGDGVEPLPGPESDAAMQSAVYAHFDALFRRRGYMLVSTEQRDGLSPGGAYTRCVLKGRTDCSKDQPDPPDPMTTYVKEAHYVRREGLSTIRLTYKADGGNTWVIVLDDVPGSGFAR